MRGEQRSVSPTLLAATTETLRRLGPRQFSLTAVPRPPASRAARCTTRWVAVTTRSRPRSTIWHRRSRRRWPPRSRRDRRSPTRSRRLPSSSVHTASTRTRRTSRNQRERPLLLLRNIGDDLMKRSIELWKPQGARSAAARRSRQRGRSRAGQRMDCANVVEFRAVTTDGVNLDSPRAVRRFVADHIVAGLAGASHE